MPRRQRDVLHRWERNPIITLEDIPFPCNTVFNGGVIKCNGQYMMLLRVEGLRGPSVILLAHSVDGYHFTIDDKPAMVASTQEPFKTYESGGIEDPRITYLEGEYYIVYTAASGLGARIAIAKTNDFQTYERVALASESGNKDGMLFPEKINGEYVRLERPIAHGVGNIWIAYSEDLIHWGKHKPLIEIRGGHWWDCFRVGGSAVPIKTEKGWLEIYHGVKWSASGPIYRLGAVLLDLEDPSKVIARGDIPILSPRERYERVGDISNVVFSCGAILEDDGEVKVYYGAADTCICVGTAMVDEIIESCLNTYTT